MDMILGIAEAGQQIKELVEKTLGPLANNFEIRGSDVRDILIQLVATIILFVIVRVFLWKPITKILETRRETIDKELSDAQEAKEHAIEIESNLALELANAKANVKALLDKAEKDGNARREAIINDAQEEARRRLENLEFELKQEKEKMEKEIKQEIVDIAFAAAEKIVSKEIDRTKYLDVVDGILKESHDAS